MIRSTHAKKKCHARAIDSHGLSGIVIHQLASPGASIVWGGAADASHVYYGMGAGGLWDRIADMGVWTLNEACRQKAAWKAQGLEVGKSICEKGMKDTALSVLAEARKHGCKIVLPVDLVVAEKFGASWAGNASSCTVTLNVEPTPGSLSMVRRPR